MGIFNKKNKQEKPSKEKKSDAKNKSKGAKASKNQDLTEEFWGNDKSSKNDDVTFIDDVAVEDFLQEKENSDEDMENEEFEHSKNSEESVEDFADKDDVEIIDEDGSEVDAELEDDSSEIDGKYVEDVDFDDIDDEDIEEAELEQEEFLVDDEDEDPEDWDDDDDYDDDDPSWDDVEDEFDSDDDSSDDDLDDDSEEYSEDDFYEEENNDQVNDIEVENEEEISEDQIDDFEELDESDLEPDTEPDEEKDIAAEDSEEAEEGSDVNISQSASGNSDNSDETKLFDLEDLEEIDEDLELPDWQDEPEEDNNLRFKKGSAEWDDIDAAFAAVHEEIPDKEEDDEDVEKAMASSMRVRRISAAIGDSEETTGLAGDMGEDIDLDVIEAEEFDDIDDVDLDEVDPDEVDPDEVDLDEVDPEAEEFEYIEDYDYDEDEFIYEDDTSDEPETELEVEISGENESPVAPKVSAEYEFDDEIESLDEYKNPEEETLAANSSDIDYDDELTESEGVINSDEPVEPEPSLKERAKRSSKRPKVGILANSSDTLNNRLVTGGIMAVIALICFALGTVTSLLLVCVLLTLTVFEFSEVLRKQGSQPATIIVALGTIGLTAGAYAFGMVAYIVVLPVTIIATTAWYLFKVVNARPLIGIAMSFFTFVYISILGSFAGLQLSLTNAEGKSIGVAVLVMSVVCSIAYDVAAYFVGKAMGETPLVIDVSPNKTLEGYLAGVVASIVVGGLFGIFGPYPFQGNFFTGLIIGVVVALFAPMGDLVESMIKRDLGIKDISSMLPGHGGFLDRFDGLLFVLPGVFFATILLVN